MESKANDFPVRTFLVWYAWLSVVITLLNVFFYSLYESQTLGIFIVLLPRDLNIVRNHLTQKNENKE